MTREPGADCSCMSRPCLSASGEPGSCCATQKLPSIAECLPKHMGQRICVSVDPGSGCDTVYEGSGRSPPSANPKSGATEPKCGAPVSAACCALPSPADASGAASARTSSEHCTPPARPRADGAICPRHTRLTAPRVRSYECIGGALLLFVLGGRDNCLSERAVIWFPTNMRASGRGMHMEADL